MKQWWNLISVSPHFLEKPQRMHSIACPGETMFTGHLYLYIYIYIYICIYDKPMFFDLIYYYDDEEKSPDFLLLVGRITRNIYRWINSPHKGQWHGKCFHLMTLSCHSYMLYTIRLIANNNMIGIGAARWIVHPTTMIIDPLKVSPSLWSGRQWA